VFNITSGIILCGGSKSIFSLTLEKILVERRREVGGGRTRNKGKRDRDDANIWEMGKRRRKRWRRRRRREGVRGNTHEFCIFAGNVSLL